MNRLPAQLTLELWVLRPYARQFALLPVLALVLGLVQDSVIPIMLVMGALTGSYAFAVTETSHLEALFATLPSKRWHLVVARYAIAAGIVLLLGLLGLGFDAAKAALLHQPWSASEATAILAAGLAVAALVIGIQFPFYFAMGYTRAKLVTWIVVAALGSLVAVLAMSSSAGAPEAASAPDPDWVAPALTVGGPLLGLALLGLSALVSVRLYARKDL